MVAMETWKDRQLVKNSLMYPLILHKHADSESFEGSHTSQQSLFYECAARNLCSLSDIDTAVDFQICRVQNLRTDDVFLVRRFEAGLWKAGTDLRPFGCHPPKERAFIAGIVVR